MSLQKWRAQVTMGFGSRGDILIYKEAASLEPFSEGTGCVGRTVNLTGWSYP